MNVSSRIDKDDAPELLSSQSHLYIANPMTRHTLGSLEMLRLHLLYY
jgi:hypothetical protein